MTHRRLTIPPPLLVLLLATACEAPSPEDGPPRVTVDGEILEGALFGGPSEAVFLGIPYAAPPVGELRWRPPQPTVPREGVQPAVAYSPGCVQSDGNVSFKKNLARVFGADEETVPEIFETSEDCLYLNVWTPAWGGEEKLPVMMWIHGGSNTNGATRESVYDGAALAREGVVLVTINYRLGVFGFFAHEELTAESDDGSSGNYALLDQIAALQWIRRNAAAFGGDPERVTIFGESAGAADVAYLMSSPLARGLFHRAISQSGGYPATVDTTLEVEEKKGAKLAAKLGIEGEGSLTALRARSAEEIQGVALLAYSPNVDGHVLTQGVGHAFLRGEQSDVPLLIGWTADEWTSLRHYFPLPDRETFHGTLRATFGDAAREALAIYGVAEDGDLVHANDVWMTDSFFLCPSRFLARSMEKVASDVWVYVFTRTLAAPGGDDLRAFHAAELAYVFGTLDREPWVPREPCDEELAETLRSYWTAFAKNGDPNVSGLPAWPAFDTAAEAYLELGAEVRSGAAYRREACELIEQALRKRLM